MCTVEELDELAIPDRTFLVSQLDSLGMAGRSAADLAVSWWSQRAIGARKEVSRERDIHGLVTSPPV